MAPTALDGAPRPSGRDQGVLPVPAIEWTRPATLRALVERNLTDLYRMARRYGYSQTQIGTAVGKSQPQVSEIMNAEPPHRATRIDVLHRHISAFSMPIQACLLLLGVDGIEEVEMQSSGDGSVRRRDVLRSLGMLPFAAASPAMAKRFPDDSTSVENKHLQRFGWELHARGVESITPSLLPPELREWAVGEAGRTLRGFVIRDGQTDTLRLWDASMVDILVAQVLAADIETSANARLARAQTSHRTDRLLSQVLCSDSTTTTRMRSWLITSTDPVLRVNCAGILAKVPQSDLGEEVVLQLRRDEDVRSRYVTAVCSRVLNCTWSSAERLGATLVGGPHAESALGSEEAQRASQLLSSELRSGSDCGARWCAAMLLNGLRRWDTNPDDRFSAALETETSREVLRTIAVLLAGRSVDLE